LPADKIDASILISSLENIAWRKSIEDPWIEIVLEEEGETE
jgi:hypothetical protein